MRLALIGDIHLFQLTVSARRLLNKRLLGHANLYFIRRFQFNHAILDALFKNVREAQPDIVLCSGDVTTTSLEDEFEEVDRYFRPIHEDLPVVIVPGNHDRYTFQSRRTRVIERHLRGMLPRRFPWHRKLTPRWHLLALDSAIPQVVMSRGALGRRQFRAVARRLERVGADQGVVILCHYPAILPKGMPNAWSHAMAEAGELRGLIDRCPGHVVFLHGHIHRPWSFTRHRGKDMAPITCINAGSPALTSRKYPLGQGYWQIDLPD
ncbi:MAG: metallophosphoesterase, partial [Rhodospirillales bacterium]|nr:metallophosphoesterase [Rhodospirillales bacterium]